MSFVDYLRWSIRHCRKRLFESILIVLAIGLGIAVIVAIVTLFTGTSVQSDTEWMRQFSIYSAAYYGTRQTAILERYVEKPREPLKVTWEELLDLQKSLPDYMHVFVEDYCSAPTPLLPIQVEDSTESMMPRYESFVAVVPEAVVIEEDSQITFDNDLDVSMYAPSPYPNPVMNQYEDLLLIGTNPEYFIFKNYQIAQGTLFVDADIADARPVIILTDKLAKRLFGDDDPIGKVVPIDFYWTSGVQEFTVIGVLAPFTQEQQEQEDAIWNSESRAYIPFTIQPYTLKVDNQSVTVNSFSIGVDEGTNLAHAGEIVESEIRSRFGELAVVNKHYEHLTSLQDDQFVLYLIIGIFTVMGLVIAVINILNLMLARVLKRTKTIGLSKAIGASKLMVFIQFIFESLFLGCCGALVGVALAFGVIQLLNSQLMLNVSFGWEGVLTACGLGILVSLLYGVYPAYQGATIDPIDALRSE